MKNYQTKKKVNPTIKNLTLQSFLLFNELLVCKANSYLDIKNIDKTNQGRKYFCLLNSRCVWQPEKALLPEMVLLNALEGEGFEVLRKTLEAKLEKYPRKFLAFTAMQSHSRNNLQTFRLIPCFFSQKTFRCSSRSNVYSNLKTRKKTDTPKDIFNKNELSMNCNDI